MKTKGIVCALALMLAPLTASADDEVKAEMEALMQEMMEKAKQMATPGKHHEALGRLVGDWDVELTMIMPGGEGPQKSKGTARYSWAIEGRWLTQRIDALLMGQPYESFSVIGFDNYAKNHVATVVSSFDTAMITARGVVVDPEGKLTAVYGTLDEYTTDEFNKPFKSVTRYKDPDHHVMEVWDLGIGADGVKVLEYAFTRRK